MLLHGLLCVLLLDGLLEVSLPLLLIELVLLGLLELLEIGLVLRLRYSAHRRGHLRRHLGDGMMISFLCLKTLVQDIINILLLLRIRLLLTKLLRDKGLALWLEVLWRLGLRVYIIRKHAFKKLDGSFLYMELS